MMVSSTAVYWLSIGLLLVTIFDVSPQRHAVASADIELQAVAPAVPSNQAGDIHKRRFMFGRRDAAGGEAPDLWSRQMLGHAPARRRFKFGKKASEPSLSAAAEKRKMLMFGKRWSDGYSAQDDKLSLIHI